MVVRELSVSSRFDGVEKRLVGWERSKLAGKYCLSLDDEAEVAAVSLFA